MIIAVTGIRDLSEDSRPAVESASIEAASEATEMRFGGATGSDTVSLEAAGDGLASCVVVVPDRVSKQPSGARSVIRKYADSVVEMRRPDFPSATAYYARNAALLEGADRLLAFTDGSESGGTWWTMKRADSLGIPIDIVYVLKSYSENPRAIRSSIDLEPSRPTFVMAKYDRSNWRTEIVLALKALEKTRIKDMQKLVRELKRQIEQEPSMDSAESIVVTPRRLPGRRSDLAPIASMLAEATGKKYVPDWLIRTEEPVDGRQFLAGRMRFPSEEHARTMRVSRAERPRSVVVLDNVLTTGGSLEGSYRAIARDAPDVKVVGLSILYSPDVETD